MIGSTFIHEYFVLWISKKWVIKIKEYFNRSKIFTTENVWVTKKIL